LFLSLSLAAAAGPPFLTDDPEPVDFKNWEAYLFSALDDASGKRTFSGPALELNYGAAPELQIHLEVPTVWSIPKVGRSSSGLGDIELGFKVRFVQETDTQPQIGVFPMIEFPTGYASRGLGNGKAWFKLPLWFQKSWGDWTTYGGGGYAFNHAPGQRDYAFGGWLLQRSVGDRLTLGGEVFSRGADSRPGRSTALANAGGIYEVTPHFSLLFSAGRSFEGERHTVAYLGLYWTWGPEKKLSDAS